MQLKSSNFAAHKLAHLHSIYLQNECKDTITRQYGHFGNHLKIYVFADYLFLFHSVNECQIIKIIKTTAKMDKNVRQATQQSY